MKKISSLEEFYQIIDNDDVTVIYFYTDWCPDCFRSKLYLPKLIKLYSQLSFYKVNRDQLLDLSSHLGIYGIPSFLIFQNGDELGRFVSKMGKSYLEVKQFIDDVLS